MDTETTMVSVREELRFIESYINIQKQRYTDRFEYVLDIQEEAMEYMIPKLIIQPIVENALIHGIEPLERPGTIHVRAWTDETSLYFSIFDNGMGSSINFDQLLNDKNSEHIGLVNVNKRIKLYYGDDYGIEWESILNQGTVISIRLSKRMKGDF